jgi:hypothetical protein
LAAGTGCQADKGGSQKTQERNCFESEGQWRAEKGSAGQLKDNVTPGGDLAQAPANQSQDDKCRQDGCGHVEWRKGK